MNVRLASLRCISTCPASVVRNSTQSREAPELLVFAKRRHWTHADAYLSQWIGHICGACGPNSSTFDACMRAKNRIAAETDKFVTNALLFLFAVIRAWKRAMDNNIQRNGDEVGLYEKKCAWLSHFSFAFRDHIYSHRLTVLIEHFLFADKFADAMWSCAKNTHRTRVAIRFKSRLWSFLSTISLP